MSFFNSLVNQIGREVGRDVYRSLKNKAYMSADYEKLSDNRLLIADIENFKISKYNKTTYTNFQKLTNDVLSSINYKCFFFDDVYFNYIQLVDKVMDSLSVKMGNATYRLSNDFYTKIEQSFKTRLKFHLEWIDDMIAMKEASIAIEKANIKLYESKNFFSKLFHSKKPKKSLLAIEKLNVEVESLKQYIETWNNLDVKFQ